MGIWGDYHRTLSTFAADAPVVCTLYAKDNKLLNLDGWKRFKSIAKREKKLFRMVNQAKLQSYRSAKQYKYGFKVPRNHEDAMRLDAKNKNSKWRDAEIIELDQINDYKSFKDLGYKAAIPKGYKKIRVHMVYDVMHDG